jgi:hypothetical protein
MDIPLSLQEHRPGNSEVPHSVGHQIPRAPASFGNTVIEGTLVQRKIVMSNGNRTRAGESEQLAAVFMHIIIHRRVVVDLAEDKSRV